MIENMKVLFYTCLGALLLFLLQLIPSFFSPKESISAEYSVYSFPYPIIDASNKEQLNSAFKAVLKNNSAYVNWEQTIYQSQFNFAVLKVTNHGSLRTKDLEFSVPGMILGGLSKNSSSLDVSELIDANEKSLHKIKPLNTNETIFIRAIISPPIIGYKNPVFKLYHEGQLISLSRDYFVEVDPFGIGKFIVNNLSSFAFVLLILVVLICTFSFILIVNFIGHLVDAKKKTTEPIPLNKVQP